MELYLKSTAHRTDPNRWAGKSWILRTPVIVIPESKAYPIGELTSVANLRETCGDPPSISRHDHLTIKIALNPIESH